MSLGRAFGAMLLVALPGCGSGGGDGGESDPGPLVPANLTFSGSTLLATDKESVTLTGSAFVPVNSSCNLVVYHVDPRDPFSPPTGYGCPCTDSGAGRVTWTNATTGGSGVGDYTVSAGSNFLVEGCLPRHSSWRTLAVPLAPGENIVTVTMRDGKSIGGASVNVTRN